MRSHSLQRYYIIECLQTFRTPDGPVRSLVPTSTTLSRLTLLLSLLLLLNHFILRALLPHKNLHLTKQLPNDTTFLQSSKVIEKTPFPEKKSPVCLNTGPSLLVPRNPRSMRSTRNTQILKFAFEAFVSQYILSH